MIGDKTHIGAQQRRQAAALHTEHRGRFAAPEVAVVHEQRIRAPGHGPLQNRVIGGDRGGQAAHPGTTLDLESVGTVIAKARALQ